MTLGTLREVRDYLFTQFDDHERDFLIRHNACMRSIAWMFANGCTNLGEAWILSGKMWKRHLDSLRMTQWRNWLINQIDFEASQLYRRTPTWAKLNERTATGVQITGAMHRLLRRTSAVKT